LDRDLRISRAGVFAARVARYSSTPQIPALAPYPGATPVGLCPKLIQSELVEEWFPGPEQPEATYRRTGEEMVSWLEAVMDSDR
jgi:hypothetical protein